MNVAFEDQALKQSLKPSAYPPRACAAPAMTPYLPRVCVVNQMYNNAMKPGTPHVSSGLYAADQQKTSRRPIPPRPTTP